MKPIGLPRKVWVGEFVFPMALAPRATPGLGEEADGLTVFDPPNRGILIANDLSLMETLITVFHELTHAMNYAGDVSEGEEAIDDPVTITEEDLADVHGKLWARFWIANPRFQAWHTRTVNLIRKEMKTGGDDGKAT